MTSAVLAFEGTAGAAPSAPSGSYTMGWTSNPAAGAADCELSGTVALAGAKSGRVNSTTKLAVAYGSGAVTSPYFSGYFYLTAAPATNMSIALYTQTGNTSSIGISTDRRLFVSANQTGGNLYASDPDSGASNQKTAANTVPLNQWFRVSGYLNAGGGTLTAYLNSGATLHSVTPDTTLSTSTSATSSIYDPNFGMFSCAPGGALRTFITSGQYGYMDELKFDTASMPAPSLSLASLTFETTVGAAPSNPSSSTSTSLTWYNDPAGSCLVSTDNPAAGTRSGKISSTAKAATAYGVGTAIGTHYYTAYYYLTAAPSVGAYFGLIVTGADPNITLFGVSTDLRLFISANTTGGVYLSEPDAGTSNNKTAANMVPLNEWFRVGLYVNQVTSQAVARIYKGGDIISTTPTAEITAACTALIHNDPNWGLGSSATGGTGRTFLPPGQFAYMDAMEWDSNAWPAPLGVAPTNPVSSGASFAGIVPI
jgi:hypothetical protein